MSFCRHKREQLIQLGVGHIMRDRSGRQLVGMGFDLIHNGFMVNAEQPGNAPIVDTVHTHFHRLLAQRIRTAA